MNLLKRQVRWLFVIGSVLSPNILHAFVNGQNASLVLGQSNFTSGAANTTQNGMYSPYGASFDSSGNLWVADTQNSRVLEFSPPFSNGMNASLVLGQPDFTSYLGTTTQNGLDEPHGVTMDSSGNLWVADLLNNRVLEFSPPFSNGMNASLVIGQPDFTVSYGLMPQNELHQPHSVAVDSSGNLWVTDTGDDRVLEFSPPFSNGMNASLVIGQPNFTSGNDMTTQNGMSLPYGASFDSSGNLWVADMYNSRVLEFSPPFSNGMNASLVLGQPDFTSYLATTTQNGMAGPEGASFDSSGNLWVVDSSNKRVLEFSPPFSNYMNASLVLGQSNFISSVTATTQNGFSYPGGAAVDSSGNVWVADLLNSRVLEFTQSITSSPFTNISPTSLTANWNSTFPSGTIDYAELSTGTFPNNFSGNLSSATLNDFATFSSLSWSTTYYAEVSTSPTGPFTNLGSTSTIIAPAPSNFTGTTQGISSITWTWNAISGATGYDFYPSTGGAPISLTATSLTQTGLSTNTSYGAQIAAFDSTEEGPLSTLVSTHTLSAPPTGFIFSQVFTSSLTVSWLPNTNPAGTSYQIEYWQATGSTVTVSTTALQKSITGLSSGTTYYLTVNAINGSSTIAPSGIVLSTVTVPAAPTGFSGAVLGISSISWTWNASTGATGYEFYPSTGGAPISLMATSLTQTGLSTNTSYGTQIAAFNATGKGSLSTLVSTYTLAAPATGFIFTQVFVSSLTVSWLPNTNPASTTSYRVQYWESAGSTTSVSTTANQETVIGLSPSTSYFFTITSLNGDGAAMPIDIVFSTMTHYSPPVAPSGLNAVLFTSTTINWSWNAVSQASGYDVFETTSPTPSLIAITSSPTFTEINLAPDTVYSVEVAGFNNGGIGGPSPTATATTSPAPLAQNITSSGGSMTFQSLEGPDTLNIPPGAYSQNVQITLSEDSGLTCNASPAENLTPTNIEMSVSLNPTVEPQSPVTISLSYQNASIGSMNPQEFIIARCDENSGNEWVPLPSTLDSISKTVTATSGHLSLFQIMQGTPPSSVSQFQVGPNPLRPSLGQTQMKFIVPPNSNIKIFTVTGEMVKDLTASSSGTASWDATNKSGARVASGVYFVIIQGSGGSKTIKVIVER